MTDHADTAPKAAVSRRRALIGGAAPGGAFAQGAGPGGKSVKLVLRLTLARLERVADRNSIACREAVLTFLYERRVHVEAA